MSRIYIGELFLGLSILESTAKIESCASLGRPFVAVSGFIEDLRPLVDVRYTFDYMVFWHYV